MVTFQNISSASISEEALREQRKCRQYIIQFHYLYSLYCMCTILLSGLSCLIHFQNKSKSSFQPQAEHQHQRISFPAFTLTEYVELAYNKGYHGNDLIKLSNFNSQPPLIFQLHIRFEILKLQFIALFTEQKQFGCNNTVQFCLYSFSVLTSSRNFNPNVGSQITQKDSYLRPFIFLSLHCL